MNQPAQDLPTSFNRKVWVLNMWDRPYTEEFRGSKITIPPNGEKKVMMGYVEARRFLGQSKAPAVYIDGPQGKQLHPESSPPKMLKTVEMTVEETSSVLGKTVEDLKAEAKEEAKELKFACALCEKNFKNDHGLKIHTSTQHPSATHIE